MEKKLCSVYPGFSISGAGCDPIQQNYVDRTGNDCKRNVRKRNKGVQLSTDPQSVAARHRRHRISDRFKILQSLVPGGTKMDTVSMLDEAIRYVKFLKTQIWIHQVIMAMDNQSSASCSSLMPPPPPPPPPPPLPFNSDFTSERSVFFNDSSLF